MTAAHETTGIHPDEKIKLGRGASKLTMAGVGVGVIGLAGSLIFALRQDDHFQRFFHSYLVAFMWALSIAVGALFFVIVQHLTRAKVSPAYRRLGEILSQAFPILGLLSLVFLVPMLAGNTSMYEWLDPHHTPNEAFHHHVAHKHSWLSPAFFAGRVILYFVIWTGLARYFFKKSVAQDASGDPAISDKLRVAAGPGIILFAMTTIFAAFDLLMTLEATWYSTIFGVWFFAGSVIAVYASMALFGLGLQRSGRLTRSITTEHYHDIGKMMFAFVFFWTYISFSQFVLIWYANIPEETVWFYPRLFSDWKFVSIALLVGHFAFPFVFLLSRWTKRITASRTFFAVWLLLMHYIDIYWNVMPTYSRRVAEHAAALAEKVDHPTAVNDLEKYQQLLGTLSPSFSAIDLFTLLMMAGFFVAAVGRASRKVNLIAIKDPKLGESLSFQNF
jgi:hypothetical protein